MKYGLIYADPPWWEQGGGKCKRGADRHYPLMQTADIAALPVGSVAADDCVLLLWTTASYLQAAFRVGEAWGFRYVTNRVWAKVTKDGNPATGLGQWVRMGHEHLLLFRRGKVHVPAPPDRAPSVLYAERGKHSEKPDEARLWGQIIAPTPWLELFARRETPGWDTLGNEVGEGGDLSTALRRLSSEG